MAIPLEYSPLTKVVPCDPGRVPHLPAQVLYLVAQALPQPSQVFNLARVNKTIWDYLQPALYECEVTYEARLVARFGDGLTKVQETLEVLHWGSPYGQNTSLNSCPIYLTKVRSLPNADGTGRTNDGDGDDKDTEDDENGTCRRHCPHGLVTALCEVCPQRIAIEDKRFWSHFFRTRTAPDFFKSPGMTALHWACYRGESGLPVARKAIKAAKAHQPAYINGQGLCMRTFASERLRYYFLGEIPPPLFTAAAFGNTKLCEELVEAGCNLNLLQGKGFEGLPASRGPLFQIHESCVCRPNNPFRCQKGAGGCHSTDCQTAGHVALDYENIDTLGFLLDRGLDPRTGSQPLMHQAIHTCDLAAIRILLDRFPEMISQHWGNLTCLHVLCKPNVGVADAGLHSLEKLESVAAYLVRKGANLEAQAGSAGGISPLQFAIRNFTNLNSGKLYAAEALINLGAVWNQSLAPTGSTDTILSYCVYQAVSRHLSDICGFSPPNNFTIERLAFARLVKAIVRRAPHSTPVPAPAQGSVPPMQAYLGAFKMLVARRETLDTFALEALGKELLSTGISPDQGDIEKWNSVIAGNAEERASIGMRQALGKNRWRTCRLRPQHHAVGGCALNPYTSRRRTVPSHSGKRSKTQR